MEVTCFKVFYKIMQGKSIRISTCFIKSLHVRVCMNYTRMHKLTAVFQTYGGATDLADGCRWDRRFTFATCPFVVGFVVCLWKIWLDLLGEGFKLANPRPAHFTNAWMELSSGVLPTWSAQSISMTRITVRLFGVRISSIQQERIRMKRGISGFYHRHTQSNMPSCRRLGV